MSGVVAKNNFSTTAKQGVGSQGGDRGHRETPPDFEKAAKTLAVSPHKFEHAIMDNGGRDLNISAAAKDLGVTEAELKAAFSPLSN